MNENQASNTYSNQQPQLNNVQDRATLVTLMVEFGSILQQFPKLRAELDTFLESKQTLDYTTLANNIRPKLEQAAAFLFDIEHLPVVLLHDTELKQFIEKSKANMALQSIIPYRSQFFTLRDALHQRKNHKKTQGRNLKHYLQAISFIGLVAAIGLYYWPMIQKAVVTKSNTIEPEMISIPAGSFTMGCLEKRDKAENSHQCNDNEIPAHDVNVKSFEMARYEVTFAQWDVCEKEKACPHADDENLGRNNRPVVNISWDDTQTYLQWLNKKTGQHYRLPTEAEWEYAARAGGNAAYPWGMSIDANHANYGNNVTKATPAGQYLANNFGLHDMHGNVWEWCQDQWHDNYTNAPSSEAVTTNAQADRVLRGGSWIDDGSDARSAARFKYEPTHHDGYIGFRLALGS